MFAKKLRTDTERTRQRLLRAAAEVFAAKGYWAATNADICEKAEVNTAAVSYHFGGKDNLYVEAWKFAFEKSLESYPPDGGVTPEASPEERLRGRISALVQRSNHPENLDLDIIQKEVANPTGLLNSALHEVFEPMDQEFAALLKELLGDKATMKEIRLCLVSVMSQCLDPMLRSHFSKQAIRPPETDLPFSLEELADHITQFSLSGIRGVREALQKESTDTRAQILTDG